MGTQHIQTKAQVEEFVALLRSPSRKHPVVAVSTPNRVPQPIIDVDRVSSVLEDDASVFLIPTGPLTYALADLMVDGTHVYGGAGRVYPPGTDWEHDLRLSPLRLAFTDAEGHAAATKLIADADNHQSARTEPVAPLRNPVLTAEQQAKLTLTPRPVPQVPVTPAPVLAPVPAAPADSIAKPEIDPVQKPGALRQALLQIAALNAANEQLRSELETQQGTISAQFTSQLRDAETATLALRRQLEETRERHSDQVAALRKKPTKAAAAASLFQPDLFPTEEEAVRHAVYLSWVERVPQTEKAATPLPEYAVGPEFASSLGKLDAGQLTKALKCVVDVLCDLARDSRALHPLRPSIVSTTGITRGDSAICWRAAVEQKAASARRLHFWKLADGTIELSRVVTHEDMKP